jgi:hypothetical protein
MHFYYDGRMKIPYQIYDLQLLFSTSFEPIFVGAVVELLAGKLIRGLDFERLRPGSWNQHRRKRQPVWTNMPRGYPDAKPRHTLAAQSQTKARGTDARRLFYSIAKWDYRKTSFGCLYLDLARAGGNGLGCDLGAWVYDFLGFRWGVAGERKRRLHPVARSPLSFTLLMIRGIWPR